MLPLFGRPLQQTSATVMRGLRLLDEGGRPLVITWPGINGYNLFYAVLDALFVKSLRDAMKK